MVGASLGFKQTHVVHSSYVFFVILSALGIQIGTNYINDAADFMRGADTKERLGPARISQRGLVAPHVVMWAGFLMFFCAALFAIPLVLHRPWIILVGLGSILAGYAYTAGPYPLAYLGLGELFVVLFFGHIAVAGTAYVVADAAFFNPYLHIVGFEIGLLASLLIGINNVRDAETDRVAHKKTLAVRFGTTRMRQVMILSSVVPFMIHSFIMPSLWILPPLIASGALIRRLWKEEPSAKYNELLMEAGMLQLSAGVCMSLGFLQ